MTGHGKIPDENDVKKRELRRQSADSRHQLMLYMCDNIGTASRCEAAEASVDTQLPAVDGT